MNNGTTNVGSAFTYSQASSSQTITFNTFPAYTYGDVPVTLTATASSGLTVTYASSNLSVATISGNIMTIVGAGTTNITASQAGNGLYNPAPDVIQALDIKQKTLTVPDAVAANKVYDGTVATTISGTLTGKVGTDNVTLVGTGTFADPNVANGIAVTSTSTLAGTVVANYALAQPTGLTANITQASQTITFGALASVPMGTAPYTLTATASSTLTVTYQSSNPSVATISGSQITIVGAGTSTITASQAGNTNYAAATPVPQTLTVTSVTIPLAAWDFYGVGSTSLPTYAATVFNANLVSASGANNITRGATAAWSTGGNSFRTVGFKNEGIATTNTDYFQITLTPAVGNTLSLSTINAKLAGTASFCVSPGVSNQFAYSLDGTTFTLISTPQAIIGSPGTLTEISLTGISTLQNVAGGTTVTLRYYASGITTTGGWGFYSSAAGSYGLAIGGTVASAGNLAPTVTTQAATSILTTTATGNGNITYTGGVNPTLRGFCWDLAANADPDTLDSKVVETGSFSNGAFTGNITGLTPGAQYRVRAFALNSVGISYGTAVTFYALSGEPTNHATSFTASPTSQVQIDLTFSAPTTITNCAGYIILQRVNLAPTGLPVDATGYTVGGAIGDGTVAALITNTGATTASITGLTAGTHYYFTLYPYNWDGTTAATYNYKTDGTVPVTDATTNAPLDATSNVNGPALFEQPNPGTLSSLINTDAAAVHVFDMAVFDYANTDAFATKVTQVTIKPGTNNTANWATVLQGIKLSIDGGATFVTTGTPVITATSIVVPITSGNLNIPNGESRMLSLYVYLKTSGLTDNQKLEFMVDATAASHGFVADATGSTFLATFATPPVSNQITIGVVATKLKYVQQPSNANLNIAMTPAVTIEAVDANNNRDLDVTGSVSLVSSGTMTGPVTATLAAGFGTFGSIVHTALGTGLSLTASLSGLTDAVSTTFTVTLLPTMTELVIPKYIGGRTAAAANNARTPIAVCLKLDNLLPNTAYDIKLGLCLTSEAANSFGAGVWWNGTTYTNTNLASLFTTDATGSSGSFWVYVEPTNNSTGGRFLPGSVHNLRVGYVAHGGTMASAPNFVSTKTFTCLDMGTTALTPATTDDGAFIKGSADPTTTGKYVLLFDNVEGTGDPLYSYIIRQAGATNASQSEIPMAVNDVYNQSGTSAIGDYPAIVPIGANNPNGVRRIEARNADNTISGYNTDADGIWPSGVNTTTLARRDVGIVTVTDAPLVPVVTNKTLNVKVFLEGLYSTDNASLVKVQNADVDGNQWNMFAGTVADTISVSLAETTDPFATVYDSHGDSIHTDGTIALSSIPASLSGDYYIIIRHRNHVETWSQIVSFAGSTINYDFTDDIAKAWGSNQKQIGSAFCLFTGDANADQYIDGFDLALVFNQNLDGAFGYRLEDVNGDGFVDGFDLALVFNNNLIGAGMNTPVAPMGPIRTNK